MNPDAFLGHKIVTVIEQAFAIDQDGLEAAKWLKRIQRMLRVADKFHCVAALKLSKRLAKKSARDKQTPQGIGIAELASDAILFKHVHFGDYVLLHRQDGAMRLDGPYKEVEFADLAGAKIAHLRRAKKTAFDQLFGD